MLYINLLWCLQWPLEVFPARWELATCEQLSHSSEHVQRTPECYDALVNNSTRSPTKHKISQSNRIYRPWNRNALQLKVNSTSVKHEKLKDVKTSLGKQILMGLLITVLLSMEGKFQYGAKGNTESSYDSQKNSIWLSNSRISSLLKVKIPAGKYRLKPVTV